MKTYDERMQAILKKAKIRKAVRSTLKTAATVLGAVALVLALKQLPAWSQSRQLDAPANFAPDGFGDTTSSVQQTDAPTENPAPTQPFWTMGPPSELDAPCDYLDFASVNVKTGMPSQKDTYPAIHLIRSAEALRNFCQQRQQEYSGFERVENQAACYDDTFFADSSLIILMFAESSGSVQHQVVDVEVYENGYINILVERNVPEIGTCDMAYWYIFVEVDAVIAEDTWIGYEWVDDSVDVPDTVPPTFADPDNKERYSVTIWVPNEQMVELTKAQIERFNESNTLNVVIDATVEICVTADAAAMMCQDPQNGADLFCFDQSYTRRLVQARSITALGKQSAQWVKDNHDEFAVNAASYDGRVYAFPLAHDNGYFLYYDQSVISDEAAGSLEEIIAACEAAGKSFCFDLDNGYYLSSFFFATGCYSRWNQNAQGDYISVDDTFCSEAGVTALKGALKLLVSPCYCSPDYSSLDVAHSSAAAVVSGTWDYDRIKNYMGENMAVAELPSFTYDGVSYHLGSFGGSIMMGIKPQSDAKRAVVLTELAKYLSGEECQTERFESILWTPSNISVQSAENMKDAPQLLALIAQNQFATPLEWQHGQWWNIMAGIAEQLRSTMAPDQVLEDYRKEIIEILTPD